MYRLFAQRVPQFLVLAFVSFLLTSAASVGAAPSVRPVLTSALVSAPGSISVTGTGFTPGGKVDVTVRLLAPRGQTRDQTTTVVATRTHSVAGYYLGDGSPWDAPSTTVGGMVQVTFTHLCAAQGVTVRAFDETTETGSSWLTADIRGFALAHFGPNGSTDPARGYVPACNSIG